MNPTTMQQQTIANTTIQQQQIIATTTISTGVSSSKFVGKEFELPLATKVLINEGHLKIVRPQQSKCIPYADIGGATFENCSFVLTIHVFPIVSMGMCGSKQRVQSDIKIPCCNKRQVEILRLNLLNAMEYKPLDAPRQRRHLLILINPFSGTKQAPKVFESIRNILEMRGATLHIQQTVRPNHAYEIVKEMCVENYDGIVTISGDGLLSEVVQGVMQNPNTETVKLPIGVIPGGTGNAVAYSMCYYAQEPFDAVSCALLVNSGEVTPLDLAEVTQGDDKPPVWAFSGLYWGLIADIDLESEVCRACGSLRNDIYSVLRIANLRRYSGVLHYKLGDSPMQTIDGEFTLLAAVNLSWVDSGGVLISPTVRPDCGYWDIFIMQSPSRFEMILALLAGNSLDKPSGSITVRASEFTIEPKSRTASNPGHVDVDGEEIPFGPTKVCVKKGMASIMGRCTLPPAGSQKVVSSQPLPC